MAPTEVRGLLGSVNQLVICIGILAALVVNVALPASSWRTMFALAIAPAVVLALGEHLLLALARVLCSADAAAYLVCATG